MAYPVLPPKYYLTHFFEFIDFIQAHYQGLLEPVHLQFLAHFRSLSEDAQCVFVRMLNRKGYIFNRDLFSKYSEIENPQESLRELELEGFASAINDEDKAELISFFTKGELRKWLGLNDIETPASSSRDKLQEVAKRNLKQLDFRTLEYADRLIAQRQVDVMEYLLFLYFGRIQKSLNLYTLRDLGIRKTNTLKSTFKARFNSIEHARIEFALAKDLDRFDQIQELEEFRAMVGKISEFQKLHASAQSLKDELLFKVAEEIIGDDEALAFNSLANSRHPLARERAVRLLYKSEKKEEARILLDQILLDPRSDVELLFAEDFLARKFNKKKLGYLTEILKNADEITISDLYLKRPERGVRDHYRKLGFNASFTENHMWMGLFGVLFWDELFESESSAIHNPFERSPADLVGAEFYEKNRDSIETKLANLKDVKAAGQLVLKSLTKNYGRLNDIFLWHKSMAESLLRFLQNSTQQDVAHVLRTMAKNFESYHSGFPDLMVEKDGIIRFIEVKAEGDALRAGQLSKIRLLKEAGFAVDVLKVRWQADPNQTYVVVDVETTGGSAGFHRVTEIGAVKLRDGEVVDEFQTLINPDRPIPAFITQITGITNQMVADAPRFSDIAESFYEFLEGSIFVAHNVKFDYGFIQKEFSRAGIEFVRPQLCTCSGMRKAYPGISSYGLKNLTEHFSIALDHHHRAMCDARAAAELLKLMNSKRHAN